MYNDFFSTVVWNEITVPPPGDRRIYSIGEIIAGLTLIPPRIPVRLPGITPSSAW
jgi:hypothetical protein